MEENGAVVQLKKALNQLLGVYEKLKAEAEDLKKENFDQKEYIESLEEMNQELELKLTSLNNVSDHNSSEMDEMLGRIESILNESPSTISDDNDDSSNDNETSEEVEEANDDKIEDSENDNENDDENESEIEEDDESNKDLDLNQMKTLLNGFNN
jgi:uncharacterized membrane protein YgaE (UPF0421/DUF939 family)